MFKCFNHYKQLAFLAILSSILYSCANIGNPTGGPRDEDPPIFISANPPQGALNVDKNKITLNFNEYINLKDAYSKVVTSPVSKITPKATASGKKITIEFDSLQSNTTYTVDFADAIEDNNESNKLQGFTYTFSTGDTLDSLRISGMVLGAKDLEPQQQILVGVTQNLHDSAFTKLPLLRVAKTDDRGRFSIRGLKEGSYRIFALNDKDGDYKYANPEEDIAFYDLTIEPSANVVEATDTIFNSYTGEIDSIINRDRTQFLPNNILLRSFNSLKRSQYMSKYERMDSTRVYLKFNTEAAELPKVEAIGHPGLIEQSIIEHTPKNDSIVYWLPKKLVAVDSLRVAVNYLRTDSTNQLAAFTDTLKFFTKKTQVAKKKKEERNVTPEDSIKKLTFDFKFLSKSSQEIYDPLYLQTERPLQKLRQESFTLEQMHDTIWRPVKEQPLVELTDSCFPRDFKINYNWEYGSKYRVVVDTLAATDIYGKTSLPIKFEFKVKDKDEYCSLAINLSGLDPDVPAFVELLNSGDTPLRSQIVENNRVKFENLDPGRYFLRVTEDYNGNGLFDTGDYDLLLQPDLAYYYPKPINIKKNWDKEESWDVFSTAIDLQKPLAVKKNKPTSDKRAKSQKNDDLDEEEEEEVFDPTANPFDPNSKNRKKTTSY